MSFGPLSYFLGAARTVLLPAAGAGARPKTLRARRCGASCRDRPWQASK